MDESTILNQTQQQKREYLVIKIPKPQITERMFWISVILILGVFAFYQPLSAGLTDSASSLGTGIYDGVSGIFNRFSGSVVAETPKVEVPVEEVKAVETPVVEEPVVVEPTKPVLSGLMGLRILRVNTENKGTWGKITSVDYEIDNQKDTDFYPMIKVFAYDDADDQTLRTKEKALETSIDPLESGKKKEARISILGASFSDLTTGKTVTVQLFDQTTEKLLKAVTSVVMIN